MLRLITVPLVAVFSLVLLSFALSNRDVASFALFPLPGALALPLFLPVMLAALFGAFIGCFATWRNSAKYRKAAKDNQKLAEQLDKQVAQLRQELATRPPPPAGQAVLSPPNPLIAPATPTSDQPANTSINEAGQSSAGNPAGSKAVGAP
ncbi:MAG: hypothetical protein AAF213_06960 [Pseudomonadota bacterium]